MGQRTHGGEGTDSIDAIDLIHGEALCAATRVLLAEQSQLTKINEARNSERETGKLSFPRSTVPV